MQLEEGTGNAIESRRCLAYHCIVKRRAVFLIVVLIGGRRMWEELKAEKKQAAELAEVNAQAAAKLDAVLAASAANAAKISELAVRQ